jgi:hypothetical protein
MHPTAQAPWINPDNVLTKPNSASSAIADHVQIVSGTCGKESHIAEGQVGEDLTKRQSRFFCDSAVIAFLDNINKHVMIQFTQNESHHSPIIGFAGNMEKNGQIMDVDRVYLEPGRATKVTDSACKFFFSRKHMSSIFCGAKTDEGRRRTVAIVAFVAAPGQ